jgi:hypothetical protein
VQVLCLFDLSTGRAGPVIPARPGALRIAARTVPADLRGLCELLLPDLIRRAAELHRLRVVTARQDDAEGPAFRQAAGALNLRPPDLGELGAMADVMIGGMVRSGPVALPAGLDGTGQDPLAGLTERGLDPLALRLALLGRRYSEPLTLTWPLLKSAGQELAAWRGLAAEWARSPSGPLATAHRDRITAAFDDDLDTPAALRVLRDLAADGSVPPGARFETFADADRLFGLDLVRDVGRAV